MLTGLDDIEDWPADDVRTLLRSILFPPPDDAAVRQVVYGAGWQNRLAAQTGLAVPGELAATIQRSIVAGQSIRDLARDLLPVVNGVRATARRVARDETMRVAHAMQWAAWQQADDIITGYRINAVLDGRTRPEHRKRAGTVYWKKPKRGQKGLDEMPHPPYEADGRIAWNCRCFLTPELRIPG